MYVAGHGPLTGRCVVADRRAGGEDSPVLQVCQVQSWCPVEDDRRILGKERSGNIINKFYLNLLAGWAGTD